MMSRQFEIAVEPLWKLAGFALLLLSFAFTGWMLGNALVAADHLLDVTVDFFQDATAVLQAGHHNIFAG